jgi:hypothetical protein
MTAMNEIWKDIEEYEGLYKVSNLGRIASYKYKHKKICSCNSKKAYPIVTLCKNLTYKKIRVHVLVAAAFIPNPENKKEVNHLNGIKTDNRVCNLEWVTPKENMIHCYKIGLRKGLKGEECGRSKLQYKDILSIRNEYNKGIVSQKELSLLYGVRREQISNIIRQVSWKV